MLLLTKLKGHRSNFHYSGFPKHPQTKSSLNISICQSKLKHKLLPPDTLYNAKNVEQIHFCRMYGLAVMLSVTTSTASKNIDKI